MDDCAVTSSGNQLIDGLSNWGFLIAYPVHVRKPSDMYWHYWLAHTPEILKLSSTQHL